MNDNHRGGCWVDNPEITILLVYLFPNVAALMGPFPPHIFDLLSYKYMLHISETKMSVLLVHAQHSNIEMHNII